MSDLSGSASNLDPSRNIVTAAKGGGISFLGRIASHLISLFFVFVLARYLGAEKYGVYKLMVIITSVVAAIGVLGLSSGLKRYIAIANKQGNQNQIWGYIQIGVGVPALFSLLLTFLMIVLSEPLAIQVFKEPQLVQVLKIGSLAIPFFVLIHSFSGIALGFKKIEYPTLSQNLVYNLVKLALSVLAIILGFDIIGVTAAYIISSIVALCLLIYLVNRLFSFIRPIKSAERDTKELMSYSIPLFLSLLLNQFSRRFETMVLGAFSLSANVGVYSAILAISQIGKMGFTAVRDISSPIFSELHSQNKIRELEVFYQTTAKWAFTLNIPIFLTILVLGDTMLTIFGKEFESGSLGMIILATGTLFNAATGTCGALLNMAGYSRISFYNSIVYIITTLILDFTLIPKYELLGAALAGSLTIALVNILRLIEVYFLINKILPFNLSILKPIFAGVVAMASGYGLKSLGIIDQPILELLLLGTVMWGIYIGMIFLLKLSPEDKLILQKITKKFKRGGKKKSNKS